MYLAWLCELNHLLLPSDDCGTVYRYSSKFDSIVFGYGDYISFTIIDVDAHQSKNKENAFIIQQIYIF